MAVKNRKLLHLYLVILLILPLVFIFLPAAFFDSGQSICLSVLLFDQTCYACGMTRAIQHLIHLDFKAAYSYNILSFLVLPLIAYLYIAEIINTLKKIKVSKNPNQKI
jgi:uncharacterized integral membrane protein